MNLILKILGFAFFSLTFSTNEAFAKKKQKEIQYKEVVPPKKADTTTVDTFPRYPGGIEGFIDDLSKVVTIQGKENLYNFSPIRITVEFVIDQSGKLQLLSSVPSHYPLSNEDHIFLRIVQNGFTQLQPWQPAIKNNTPTDFLFRIPIIL